MPSAGLFVPRRPRVYHPIPGGNQPGGTLHDLCPVRTRPKAPETTVHEVKPYSRSIR